MSESDEASPPHDGGEPGSGLVLEQGPSVSRILRWLGDPPPGSAVPQERFTLEDVHEFRPALRPPVPVLTVLDDGSRETGEEVRLRGESFTIGRTAGSLVLANDPAISGTHAEIRRVPWKGGYQWHLHDLSSVNGTFVRCSSAVLHETTLVILGARRFRLRNPLRPAARPVSPSDTHEFEGMAVPETVWPVLIEASSKPGSLQLPLRSDRVSIGRTGGGADVELDDPLTADHHAILNRQRDGSWVVVADTTRNGVWVSVASIMLTGSCFFRLGEQRFRFVVP